MANLSRAYLEARMSLFASFTALEVHAGTGHDRAEFWDRGAFAVACLADGAGGMSGAGVAADRWMAAARAFLDAHGGPPDAAAWCACLAAADVSLYGDGHSGETTAVVATITADAIAGASVGDSGAWLIDGTASAEGAAVIDLTGQQKIRPLLGSGGARPMPFVARGGRGTLLLASDGLLRYARPDTIAEALRGADLGSAARAAIDRVRLGSGGLQDDVGIVLCRWE